MIDHGKVGITQGFSLAGLTEKDQRCLSDALQGSETRLNTSQAELIRKQSRSGQLTSESLKEIFEDTLQPKRRVVLTENTLRRYFADSVDPRYMEQVILELLRQWKEQNHE
jgi:hypothetical protein